jgi:serine/threonine protein kinase
MKCYDGDLSKNKDLIRGAAVFPFFRALLRTLQSIHLLGVSHEDIKRGNILILKENGRVRPILADWGFAQFVPDGGHVKSLGGTVDYSSPEKVAVSFPGCFR